MSTRTTKTIERKLPVSLTAKEQEQRGRDLAELTRSLRELIEEKKDAAREYGERIKNLNTKLEGLESAVLTGVENRLVACEKIVDHYLGQVTIKRLDTGAVVEQRAPTKEELQTEIDLPEGGKF
jgi:hypothetical protein